MATVTLLIMNRLGRPPLPVEMEGATTGEYAAMRAAESLGFDPEEGCWSLARFRGGRAEPIDPDEPVAGLHGTSLYLAKSSR